MKRRPNLSDGFRACVGVDWSGAVEYRPSSNDHPGDYPIQVAAVRAEDGFAILVRPQAPATHWTRRSYAEFLFTNFSQPRKDPRPLLIGLDFAFGLPFVDQGAYFPCLEGAPDTWLDLLAMIRGRVKPEADFVPGPVVNDLAFGEYFLHQDRAGVRYQERFRKTEQQDYLYGERATSVFKLVDAGQVGKGSVAGMAFLAELKSKLGPRIHIWPLEGRTWNDDVRAVIVEVYPRIMYRLCGSDVSTRDNALLFARMLQGVGVHLRTGEGEEELRLYGEHSSDALATAAALHRWSTDARPWYSPHFVGKRVYQAEGWIWGAGTDLTPNVEPGFRQAREGRRHDLEATLNRAVPAEPAEARYWMLRGILASCAAEGKTIRYHEAAALCGLEIPQLVLLLKRMQQNPVGDEPDLTAIVVGSLGHPGKGWNTKWEWNKETQARWEATRDAVFAWWGQQQSLLSDPAGDEKGKP
jgi:hypothetical protein